MFKVKFKTDLELDIEMTKQFLRLGIKAGADFAEAVLQRHPSLSTTSTDAQIEKVITDYYEVNSDTINKVLEKFQEQWDEVADNFFKVVADIFCSELFRDKYFEAYVSVINANPRFLEQECFQISMNLKSSVGTTAHEMLHFTFYQYTKDKFSDRVSNLDPNNGLWWHVSEFLIM